MPDFQVKKKMENCSCIFLGSFGLKHIVKINLKRRNIPKSFFLSGKWSLELVGIFFVDGGGGINWSSNSRVKMAILS
jgi:hypothetical protein